MPPRAPTDTYTRAKTALSAITITDADGNPITFGKSSLSPRAAARLQSPDSVSTLSILDITSTKSTKPSGECPLKPSEQKEKQQNLQTEVQGQVNQNQRCGLEGESGVLPGLEQHPTVSQTQLSRDAEVEAKAHSSTATSFESINATNLNTLVESLRTRLSSDAFGNFYIAGSTGADTRHGQLRDVIKLIHTIEQFQGTMEKYIATHAIKEATEAERAANQHRRIKELVDEAVKEQMAPLEDLAPRVNELEASQQAMRLANTSRDGKGVSYNDTAVKQRITDVNRRVDSFNKVQVESYNLNERRAKVSALNGDRINMLEIQVKKLEAEHSRLKNAIDKVLEPKVKKLEAQQSGLMDAVDKVWVQIDSIKSWKVNIESWRTWMDTWSDRMTTKANSEQSMRERLSDTVETLQAWKFEMQGWRTRNSHWVNTTDYNINRLIQAVVSMRGWF